MVGELLLLPAATVIVVCAVVVDIIGVFNRDHLHIHTYYITIAACISTTIYA